MLDVRRLRLLGELSRRGTIAEVAKAVGYTPSAVSQSLAQLEREVGVPLLERDGRRVRLTAAAHRLVARSDRVLAERHPEVACTVREHEPEDGIALLRSGELDVLVSESYDGVPPAPVGGLEQHLLVSEPLLLVLPGAHPAREPVELAAFGAAPWIGGLPGTQFAVALEHACRAAGFAPRLEHRADDMGLYQALAGAGLGVGLLPALACRGIPGVRFARATPAPPRRHVAALVRRGAGRRPALAATLDALRRSVA